MSAKAPDKEYYFAVFVRANEFHHQFALFAGKTGMHHIAVETDSINCGIVFTRRRVAEMKSAALKSACDCLEMVLYG